MYNLNDYGAMIRDRARVEAYAEALRKTVRPNCVVVDLGTGPGIFAVLACQLGARLVYAIEPSGIVQVAREVAMANHCSDKIEFIEEVSSAVSLPFRADVIVSDLRGALPFFERHIPSIVDARRRFLAPKGALIPRRDTVWAAVVEAPGPYGQIVGAWENNVLGQDLNSARRLAVNRPQKVCVTSDQLLTEAHLWSTLDYSTIEDADAQGKLCWSVKRAGLAHGIVAWFDADLAEGVGLSNFPGNPTSTYGCAFFPWIQPVPLTVGRVVSLNLEARPWRNDYMWRWTTRIESGNGSVQSVCFEQSRLEGEVFSLPRLHMAEASFVPKLSEEGRIRHRALELMNGTSSLEGIARRLTIEFPSRFARWEQALSYAGALSQECSTDRPTPIKR
jgi:protein arginine N-methyltransferase 1